MSHRIRAALAVALDLLPEDERLENSAVCAHADGLDITIGTLLHPAAGREALVDEIATRLGVKARADWMPLGERGEYHASGSLHGVHVSVSTLLAAEDMPIPVVPEGVRHLAAVR